MKIAVAGTGYVGMSIATLLAHRLFRMSILRSIWQRRSLT